MASSSSIYGIGPYGAPAIRTSFSAPISALNAYPGAVNAYAAGAYAAPLAAATYAAPIAAAPLGALGYAAPIAAAAYAAPIGAPLASPLAIANAVGPVSSQFHKQVRVPLRCFMTPPPPSPPVAKFRSSFSDTKLYHILFISF